MSASKRTSMPDPLTLLGFARRKGVVHFGSDAVLSLIKTKSDVCVFLASDAGANLTKKMHDKTNTYRATLIDDYTSDALSRSTGNPHTKVCAIADSMFTDPLRRMQ